MIPEKQGFSPSRRKRKNPGEVSVPGPRSPAEASRGSPLVEVVRADVHGDHPITLNIENSPQILFDFHGVDGASVVRGEPVNLVGAEAGVERIALENLPGAAGGFLSVGRRAGGKWLRKFRLPGSGTSAQPVGGRRFAQRSFHFNQATSGRVGQAPLERFGNPGIVLLDDKLHHPIAFRWRQGFDFFDNGFRSHAG